MEEQQSSSFQLDHIFKSMNLSDRSTSAFDSTPNLQQHNFFEMVLSTLHAQLVQLNKKLCADAPFDFKLLTSLLTSLQSINKHFLRDIEKLGLAKCEDIFDTCIILFIILLKKTNPPASFETDYIETILLILQEIIKPFPHEFSSRIKEQEVLITFNTALSSFETWRNLLYSLSIATKDEVITKFIKGNIFDIFIQIKDSLSLREFDGAIKEMSNIAELFKDDFTFILSDYYALITQILEINKTKRSEETLKDYFIHLTKLVLSDSSAINFGIPDMMLMLYERHITSTDIAQTIIFALFTTINGEVYVKLLQNTFLINKFISQWHNQRNQETIACFFYFLNSHCLSYEVHPNANYIPKLEFKAIIESFKHFTQNEELLIFIVERIKNLFDQNKNLCSYFLEECGYFENIQSLISTKANISETLIDFTECLFKAYLTPSIWARATEAELFHYDLNSISDPITQKKIMLSFVYELNPIQFYEKSKKIAQSLKELIQVKDASESPSRNVRNLNCEKYIGLLTAVLKAFSQTKIEILASIDGNFYSDLLILIEEYIALIISRSKDIRTYLIPLLNSIFSFIRDLNENLLAHKLSKDAKKQIRYNNNGTFVFNNKIIKKMIKDVIMKLPESEARVIVLYLYEKCLCFNITSANIGTDIDSDINKNQFDEIEYLTAKYNIPSSSAHADDRRVYSNLILNSQLIFKCLSTILQPNGNYSKFKSSFLSFSQLLCNVNSNNIPLLLQCGIIKKLLPVLSAENAIKEKAMQLLTTLLGYANKADLALYMRLLYQNLVSKDNIELSKELLSIMEANLVSSSKRVPSISLSPENTGQTCSYQMFFLNNKPLKSNVINIFLSIYVSSIESLNGFTLCYLNFYSKALSISFESSDLNFYINKHKKGTITNIGAEVPLNTWLKVHIDQGTKFTAVIKKNYLCITFPESDVFTQENKLKTVVRKSSPSQSQSSFDFAGGFIDVKTTQKASPPKPLKYKQVFPIQISYFIIMNQRIEANLINDVSISSNRSLELNTSNYTSNEIIAEVFFNSITLENWSNLAEIQYKLSQFDYDLAQTELLSAIQCNNELKNNNDHLFLLKTDSIIKYASMNSVYSIENATKDKLITHYSFNHTLDNTINDIFFVDFIYALLDNLPLKVFLETYQRIFRVVFVVNGSFQLQFFNRHIKHIRILLVNYAPYFNLDFVSLFIYNKYVDINELLQYDIISEIFFNPYLYTSLPFIVQTKLNTECEKFLNYYESNVDTDYGRLRRILVKIWNIIIHFEIDVNIPQGEKRHLNVLISFTELITSIITSNGNSEVEALMQYGFSYYNMLNDFKKCLLVGNGNSSTGVFYISDMIKWQINALFPTLEIYKTQLNKTMQSQMAFSRLAHHFWIEFVYFKNVLQNEKEHKRLRTQFQLLWPNQLEESKRFSWNLYKREGHGRMKKKMILKPNPPPPETKPVNPNNPNSQITDELTPHQNLFKKICINQIYSDIPFAQLMIASDDKYQNSYICLLIQKADEIESLLILGGTNLYIFTNIICDKAKRIFLSTKQSTRAFWARDEVIDEWDRLVSKEKKDRDSIGDPSCLIKHSRKDFQMKTIQYRQISELHKRRYMLQNNSLEIFLLNGSSYFFTVFTNNRDAIFNKIISNINDQSSHSKIIPYGKASNASVYLKRYPFIINKSKTNMKPATKQSKALLDVKTLTAETSQKWSEGLLSNFHYIMIANTLAGRTYNDLSQYFIFPWILQDFFSDNFCLSNKNYFRDFTYPVHAQSESNRDSLFKKVNNSKAKAAEDIYHSGVYISNISFVSYYLVRIKPFTQIGLDIQGGIFDTSDRIFFTTKGLSLLKNNAQEWIPEIVYFPELMVNMNNYDFGQVRSKERQSFINDIDLPQWAKLDPKYFNQILLKAVESPIVSNNLHNWFDLVFGNKMPFGKHNFDYFNRYLLPCYEYEDLKGKKNLDEFNSTLYQTKEFGSTPLQLTSKGHIRKADGGAYSFISFFGNQLRIMHSAITPSSIVCSIKSKKIGDMKGLYELPKHNVTNGEGGLSSFTSYIDQSTTESKEGQPFMIVGKNQSLIGPKYSSILSHSQRSLFIVNPANSYGTEFPLNEAGAIGVSISSSNGKYVTIGLSNGAIIKYRKRSFYTKSIASPSTYISELKQKVQFKKIDKSTVINPKIFDFNNDKECGIDYYCTNGIQIRKAESNIKKSQYRLDYLAEEKRSNWQLSALTKFALCESQSLLIAVDQTNAVYLYDFNSLKLLYAFSFGKITQLKEDISFVTIIHQSGDFILATKTSMHLFTVNGVYIGNMSLFKNNSQGVSPITSIEATSIFSTFVFTGHSDGSLVIWEVKSKIPDSQLQHQEGQPKDEESTITTSSSQSKSYFSSYHRRYNSAYASNMPYSPTQRFKLIRKFTGTQTQHKIIYLKLRDDLQHLIIINKKKELLLLGCDEFLKENMTAKGKKCSTHKSTVLSQCKICKILLCEFCNDSKLCAECNNSNTSVPKLIYDY